MNRRLAEHKSRKESPLPAQAEPPRSHLSANSRAAQAAARVAARYANAPSFNEMQAAEARAALRVAESATRAALRAQAAAQAALSQLHTHAEESEPELPDHAFAGDESSSAFAEPAIAAPQIAASNRAASNRLDPQWEWNETGLPADSASTEVVEAAQPIPANLIQFPREIVATRRMRPHVGNTAPDSAGQLSIFEVAPDTISTEPRISDAIPVSAEAEEWMAPQWSNIQFDEHSEFEEYPLADDLPMAQAIDLAPLSARLLSAIVDLSLITAVVCGFVFLVARYLHPALSIKSAEIVGGVLLVAAAVAYEWLFLTRFGATPGMRYAGIDLCTFDDQRPTREQLIARFRSMLFSLAPMGLGLAWGLFDEDNLSWHDRRSRTYQRRSC